MRAGDVVADRFEIALWVGSGGMGDVYKAWDLTAKEQVALKLSTIGATSDRFQREAEIVAAAAHPNVVRYVAHGSSGDTSYLAMEWLEGETLEARLSRGALTTAETLVVAKQLAEALAAVHRAGIVHRDVKPANVLIVNGLLSNVRLVDFGLALTRTPKVLRSLTPLGAIVGTPAYMSPEQVRGEADIDGRADVFALGAVLFECLSGRCLFDSPTPLATFARILVEDAPRLNEWVKDVPEQLEAFILKLLSKSRDERPADGASVAALVARVLSSELVGPRLDKPPSLTRLEQRLVCVVLLANVVVALDVLQGPAGPGHGETAALPWAPTMLNLEVPGALAASPSALRSTDPRLDSIRAIAKRYGADIEPLPDGSVVVVHGLRDGSPDPPAAAARSALALSVVFPGVSIALATGRSSTGPTRIIGEALDRALALVVHERSGPGVPIDDVSAGLLEARFVVEEAPSGPVLVREREAARAERTLLGRETVCVGREKELADLLGLLAAALAERQPRGALVSAAAGVGKSRLRYEFLRRIHGVAPSVSIWVGWGDPMGAGSPFGLIAPLVRRALGIVDDDAREERQRKISLRVARSLPPSEAVRVAEFLGELVGAHFPDHDRVQLRTARADTILLGDQMLRAYADFVAAEALRCPVVIVLEDIHWGDLPSLRFIESAMTRAHGAPLFVLALGRPEMFARFPDLWSKVPITAMALGEIDTEACKLIVDHALGPVNVALRQELVTRAAGNPFYLEELIRAVADGRSVSLPGTVLAVAQARLEGLPDGARQVLRAGSIFGASFSRNGVMELLSSVDPSEVDRHLAFLTEGEILTAVGAERAQATDDPEYAFRHAILRDAAHAMLTDGDCALGHRLAGSWLERRPDTAAIVLAEHFERGGAKDLATRWYTKAASQALEGNDFDEVKRRAEHAFRCGASGVEAGRLHVLSAEAHRWAGVSTDAFEHGRVAMSLLPPGSPTWWDAGRETALGAGRLGRAEELAAVARDLLAHAELPPSSAALAALARSSDYLLFTGQHELFGAILEAFGTLSAAHPDELVKRTWTTYVRATHAMMTDVSEYVVEQRELVLCFDAVGDLRNACLQRVNLGDAYIQVGHYSEAVSVSREAIAEAAQLRLDLTVAHAKTNLARALGQLGQLSEAMVVANESIEELRAAHDHRTESAAWGFLARSLLLGGEIEKAEHAARESVAIVRAPPPTRSLNLGILAEVLLAKGEVAEARALAEEAFQLLTTLGAIDDGEAMVRLVHAEALLASGLTELGRRALDDARARLMAKAATMSSPHWRSHFLTRVGENARTLALAKSIW